MQSKAKLSLSLVRLHERCVGHSPVGAMLIPTEGIVQSAASRQNIATSSGAAGRIAKAYQTPSTGELTEKRTAGAPLAASQ